MTVKPGDGTRDLYMDFLKGIAIIAVVAGHTVSDIAGMDVFFNVIYSFHMPLLFFVSAYVEERFKSKYVGREGQLVLRRMSGLLLPYLSWTIIAAAVSGWLWHTDVREFGMQLLGYGNNGMWFFPVLFGLKLMHILYWMIRNRINRNNIFTDVLILCGIEVAVALLAIVTRQPYIKNILSYAIPYFFAVTLVRYEAIQKLMNSEWLAAGAVFVYMLVFPFFSFYNIRWTTQLLRIVLSLCVIMICCKFKDKWKINRIYSAVCVCGENSLAVYVLYGFLIDYKKYFYIIDSGFLVGMASLVMAAIVASVCIVISRIIGISAWWRKILFGK